MRMNLLQIRSITWTTLLLLTAMVGCSSTALTDTWQAPSFHRDEMNPVLVVGVSPNVTNRILFERGFVEALQDKGITAIASYDVIGDALPTRESVSAYLEKSGMQYVIATRFGGAEVTTERIPESVRTYTTGPYYPTYNGYWASNSVTMVRPSYMDQKNSVILTTSVFDFKTGAAVWAGRSKTFEMRSIVNEANDLARQVVNKIAR